MVLDHAFERPGPRPHLAIEPGVEIKAIFALDMGADEGGVGDLLAIARSLR
jgi:hypothetical protein